MLRVERRSVVPASAERVWARAVTPKGINHELGPWMRMRMPRALRGKSIDDVETGKPLGRSWLLLLGAVPFDYDDLSLAELEPGRRFLERSTMLSMRTWEHERVVEVRKEGECEVSDRLRFELRRGVAWVPGVERVARNLVGRTFDHRHRRLKAYWSTNGGK